MRVLKVGLKVGFNRLVFDEVRADGEETSATSHQLPPLPCSSFESATCTPPAPTPSPPGDPPPPRYTLGSPLLPVLIPSLFNHRPGCFVLRNPSLSEGFNAAEFLLPVVLTLVKPFVFFQRLFHLAFARTAHDSRPPPPRRLPPAPQLGLAFPPDQLSYHPPPSSSSYPLLLVHLLLVHLLIHLPLRLSPPPP